MVEQGIKLVGWTYLTLVNPSDLSSVIEPLQELHNAILTKKCCLQQIPREELVERKREFEKKVAEGMAK